jgi:hypothetical protein
MWQEFDGRIEPAAFFADRGRGSGSENSESRNGAGTKGDPASRKCSTRFAIDAGSPAGWAVCLWRRRNCKSHEISFHTVCLQARMA